MSALARVQPSLKRHLTDLNSSPRNVVAHIEPNHKEVWAVRPQRYRRCVGDVAAVLQSEVFQLPALPCDSHDGVVRDGRAVLQLQRPEPAAPARQRLNPVIGHLVTLPQREFAQARATLRNSLDRFVGELCAER